MSRRSQRTREATIHRAASGGHFVKWTDETRPVWEHETETVTDRQAVEIARALDPFTMEGCDEQAAVPVAREILDGAEYNGLRIYREWMAAGDSDDVKLAREIQARGAEHAGEELHAAIFGDDEPEPERRGPTADDFRQAAEKLRPVFEALDLGEIEAEIQAERDARER